jgi:hypothetical protein
MLEDFIALSRILTGVEDLNHELGSQYLERLLSTPYEPDLREALTRFRGATHDGALADWVRQQLLGDHMFRTTVCQIILLWYTSAMQDYPATADAVLRHGSQDAYFSGLGWKLIGAHVPGLSGGYFGHWRYRPDNEPLRAV